ncbi:threonine synthase [Candidatus Bathyarchaeota archaeon]|nr:threonine synthase [Candidatus Bathyarchaeota archaeon]
MGEITPFQSCISCGATYKIDEIVYTCRKCGDLLEIKYDYNFLRDKITHSDWRSQPLSVWRYRDFLPIRDPSKVVSLNEGGTKLYHCSRLGAALGIKNLYVKNEGDNPTGSFKDRGMTVGVSKALELNAKMVACASTGNTSASLAAYAARAGLSCIILIPLGGVAYGKLAQAIIYGAKVMQVRGNFDHALKMVVEISEKHREIYLLNSINPFRLEGQKTIAYEICDQLNGLVPDRVVVPVGNAGNISAIWKGFLEFFKVGLINKLPKMTGIQAAGASPVASAIKEGRDYIVPVEKPETVASAIRIGSPISWKKALGAIRDSGGTAEIVEDDEILEAQKMLAKYEGIFVEPASASSIAGLKKLVDYGLIDKNEVVVCVATGHGLKDPDAVVKSCGKPHEVDARLEAIENFLGLLSVR